MEKKLFTSFASLLVATVLQVLCALWWPEGEPPEVLFRTIATTFLVGLGSFILWLTTYCRVFLRRFFHMEF
jgi:hypothetical protein